MPSLLISLIIIGIVTFLVTVFQFINQRNQKARDKKFIDLFNRAGEEYGLSFSSQELLRNKIIGLDGIHRKFVVVNENEKSRVINLNEVKKCFIEKKLETYSRGNEKSSGYEMFVKKIVLKFQFNNRKEPQSIVFYDNLLNPPGEEKLMEAKARGWETILSKMIIHPVKERA